MTPRTLRTTWQRYLVLSLLPRVDGPRPQRSIPAPESGRSAPPWLEPALWRQRRSNDRPWRPWP